MSKVYESYLEMEEVYKDNAWQEWLEEQERLAREEDYGLSGENMVECKAERFAKAIVSLG